MFRHLTLTAALSLIVTAPVWGQGFVITPQEPVSHSALIIPHQRIDIACQDQITRVQVNQAFLNPTRRTIEVEYFFPLPSDAVIDSFVLLVDGKEIPGRLMGRDEARRIYEDIVRRRQDPALLEYMGRGLFKASVFPVPAGAQRELNLTYSQLSPREGDVITLTYPLGTAKHFAGPIRHLEINCRMTTAQPLRSIYSPTHDVTVSRPSDRVAEVRYVARDVVPRDDLQLMFGMAQGDVGFSMMSYRPTTAEGGYFLMLASPKIEDAPDQVLPKTVVFVLDKSGSMTGRKLEQAKASLRFVLRHLNPGDAFNVIAYDTAVRAFHSELQSCDTASIDRALSFVDQLAAGGGTNIDGALRSTMAMLTVPHRPTYVLFLTDGLPTSGVTAEAQIASNCRAANGVRARLMAFGVGDDVNARLLDRLVAENHGASHYVRTNQDIEEPVSKLYSKLSAPVLSDLQLAFAGLDAARTYPTTLPDLFQGSQLVVVGRYHHPGPVEITLRGRAGHIDKVFHQRATLDDHKAPYKFAFIEKLWAERRIGYLIDEIDLHGRNPELIEEIVRLSTRHGILTPYTSFLADERVDFAAIHENSARAADSFMALEVTTGSSAVAQRITKGKNKKSAMPRQGRAQVAEDLEGNTWEVQTVQAIGSKVFFRRGGRWIDSTVTPDQDKTARVIVKFSTAYFELVRRWPAEFNQYLTFPEPVTLALDGQVYRIVDKD